MKNLKKVLFSLALVLGLMFFSVTCVYAKGDGGDVVIVPDPNPDGIVDCSIEYPGTPAYPGDEDDNEDENNDPIVEEKENEDE